MTESFRKEFQTLIENTYIPANASGEFAVATWNKILELVVSNMPKSLFRFRPVSEYSVLSFQDGTITVCHPSVFPDKYDSLVYVNTDEEYLTEVITKQLLPFADYGIKVSSDEINFMIEYLQKKAKTHKGYLKSNPFMRIACLTERVDSKYMWDRYGEGYKGFALEYDTMKLFLCAGKSENPVSIFPMIYSKERHDSTNDAMYAAVWDFVPQDNPSILKFMKKVCSGPDQLYWYRSYLYKPEDYSQEREWRLIHSKQESTKQEDYSDIPDHESVIGIYYGPDISLKDRQKLHAIASKRGISEYNVVVSNLRSYSLEVVRM